MHTWWLDPAGDDGIRERVDAVRRDITGALALAHELGETLPAPGSADTLVLWDALARCASVDLTATRAIEPHLDAVGILGQAGIDAPVGATLGVYAAEGPAGRLSATLSGDRWRLDGVKPWCSLAGDVTHALMTAWVDDERRGLFLVNMRQDGVRPEDTPWVASGLSLIPSGPVRMDSVEAIPIGEPQWYLSRPGFAWGGVGVAAIWYGAAVGIAQQMLRAAQRRTPDEIALMHLGACDSALAAARAVLREVAADVAAGAVPTGSEWPCAVRVRDVCAQTVETVLRHADHSMGPAPLTSDEHYARLVDDIRVYVRQHHAERDQITLGHALLI
ncbi:acyl-CoA dehydrogenase family protein [Blastococcus sp. Marseille-P5729]|uniref:acyl-CoA dehydrogenase family protein n=1 Tax=Blastococcus sp. Marseille-P5729 TaxID=2086582 RepID=UPI000D107D68|nr:acyl-CoA dehydrogenase family protein [Blastococcus sp. Marseille-P5729]